MTLLLVACGGKRDQGADAAKAAKSYYDALLGGAYEQFVDATYHNHWVPGSYRQQLVENAKQFADTQKKSHGSVNSVRIVNSKFNETDSTAEVFLMLCFGDSTNEEVVVPMRMHNGQWLMR